MNHSFHRQVEIAQNELPLDRSLQTVKQQMEKAGDHRTAQKMEQLLQKYREPGLRIAFCGHFSAGKSTLINQLVGQTVLPSSPIPTSANVVTIVDGPQKVEVYLREIVQPEVFAGPDSWERVQDHFKDAERVETIRVSIPSPLLREGLQLMDTPGIDSNDAAHHLATESVLHLADVVFYVMDYNHVQSEVNVDFIRTLCQQGKALYLIVNQIDKHVSWELSFDSFQEEVKQVFLPLGVNPERIFYTSMKQPHHPENEWPLLLATLEKLPGVAGSLRNSSSLLSAQQLVTEYQHYLETTFRPEKAEAEGVLQSVLAENGLEEKESLVHVYESLLASPEKFLDEAEQELRKLLSNASLVPYEVRELGKQFLAAKDQTQKAGRLLQKRRQAAKTNALYAFYRRLHEQVENQLALHVKTFLIEAAGRFDFREESWQQMVYQLQVSFAPELLEKQVKDGAVFGDAYVMNYMQDIAQTIQTLYRRKALDMLSLAANMMKEQSLPRLKALEKEIDRYQQLEIAHQRLTDIEQQIAQEIAMLLEKLWSDTSAEEQRALQTRVLDAVRQKAKEAGAIPNGFMGERLEYPQKSQHISTPQNHQGNQLTAIYSRQDDVSIEHQGKHKLYRMADVLRTAAQHFGTLEALKHWAHGYEERAARLEQQRFTVALFGAFSAGKSSFANALLGERVLPVSPNPTTAAINEILPPDEAHPHGQVLIRFKSRQQMEQDVRDSLQAIGGQVDAMSDLMSTVTACLDDQKDHVFRSSLQPNLAFLRALKKGWEEMSPWLDQSLWLDTEQFAAYVAQEEKACFVEKASHCLRSV